MFQCSSRFGLLLQDAILYGLAPCQVKFVNHQSNFSEHCTPRRRTIHISLCSLGVRGLYFLLVNVQSFQKFISSFLLFELECLVLFTAMAVVILDIPIHIWQVIHDVLTSTSIFAVNHITQSHSSLWLDILLKKYNRLLV